MRVLLPTLRVSIICLLTIPCRAAAVDQGNIPLVDPDRYVDQAVEKLETGKAGEAVTLLEEAIRIDATHLRANRLLQEIYDSRGNLRDLLPRYRELITREPDDPFSHYLLSRIYLHLAEYDEAGSAFRKAVDNYLLWLPLTEYDEKTVSALKNVMTIRPDNNVLRIMLWWHELMVSDRDTGKERIKQEIETHRPKFKASPEGLDILAEFLIDVMQDFDSARDTWLELQKSYPDHTLAPYALLRACEAMRREYAEQLPVHSLLIAEYPNSPYISRGYEALLRDLINLEEYEKAIVQAKQLIELPGAGGIDEKSITEMPNTYYGNPPPLASIGYSNWFMAARTAGTSDESLLAARSLLNSQLMDPFPYLIVGLTLLEDSDQNELCIELLERAFELAQKDNQVFTLQLSYHSEDEYREEIDRTKFRILELLADSYARSDMASEAASAADRYLEIFGKYPKRRISQSTYKVFGKAYEIAGRYEDAIEHYINSLLIKLGDAEIEESLARIYPLANPGKDWRAELDSLLHPPAGLFTLESTDGRTVSLEAMRGNVVIVNFWTTWCGGCVEKLPHLADLYRHFEGRPFEVIAISLDEDRSKVPPLLAELDLPFTVVYGGSEVTDLYGVTTIPVSFLIDTSGRIRAKQLGYWSTNLAWIEDWTRLIEELLQTQVPPTYTGITQAPEKLAEIKP